MSWSAATAETTEETTDTTTAIIIINKPPPNITNPIFVSPLQMLYPYCKFIVLNPGEIFNYKNRLIFIRNFSFIINNQYFIRH
jgi:hypothetical protein